MTYMNGARIAETPQWSHMLFIITVRKDMLLAVGQMYSVRGYCRTLFHTVNQRNENFADSFIHSLVD